MHEQLPESTFTILGGTASSEFPLYAIVVIVIMNMIGIVLTPHFIVTGGGTAKSECKVGLVTGNFIKDLYDWLGDYCINRIDAVFISA